MIFSVSSCGGIDFDPDFHVGDYINGQIVGENKTVSAFDPAFNSYGCMHETKIIELKAILERAKLPTNKIDKILSKFKRP
jgi:hypothetical protein